ncbi:MAG: hypothetical protein H8E21_02110 [Gammaproteobacteria bacterium]|nr:hypothetical protein [Gammaproteobacteria bacterium]MBL6999541.1 hypothetical protein [Gammaproteobacteria bacterium]
MKNNKGILQKTAHYSGYVSFIASIACIIFLYFKVDDLGWESPISASILASSFFFASMGVVLIVIGTSNIPSFKANDSAD